MKPGDQVKIAADDHPWNGEIGRILEAWDRQGGDWVVQLETSWPGQRVAVYEHELALIESSFL